MESARTFAGPALLSAVVVLAAALPGRAQEGAPATTFVSLTPEVFADGFLTLDANLGKVTEDGAVTAYDCDIAFEVKRTKKGAQYKITTEDGTETHRRFPIRVELDEETAVHLAPWSRDRFLCISAIGAKFTVDGRTFYIVDADMDRVLGEPGEDAVAGPDARTLSPLADTLWSGKARYAMRVERDAAGSITLHLTQGPPPHPDPDTSQGLHFINSERQRIGSPPVAWEESLRKGCHEHVEYCSLNNYFGHFQDPKKKGYTEAGARAGRQSVLASGPTTFRKGILVQLRTVYHCSGCIDPRLRTTAWVLEKGIFVWNVGAGTVKRSRARPAGSAFRSDLHCFWPPNGATDVYRGFNPGGETPMPIRDREKFYIKTLGQAVFIEVGKPEGEGFYDVVLLDPRGRRVKGYITTPMRPVYTGLVKGVAVFKNGGLACLAPRKLLKPKTRYTVEVYEGDYWKKKLIFSWWFETGTRQ